ncbi:PqqD family protein [Reyranella sp. MMS21-HV4-11]|uniref:PqqD family protein n=1 Tax=Reyranella humidisoli TaxID=2849149 RepID=A0ABS6INT6_9HYPH|nr:PqqD family protein [Reyranella sp. MMS21-HV4-11]MBU8875660.1 PqqD family protein [Reyranella sp. MMS21-HV4-11]
MLTVSTIGKRSARRVACGFSGEVVLLHFDKGRYFGFRGMGTAIWNSLDVSRAIADVCDDVAAQFDVDPAVCLDHAVRFLANLQEVGLIDVVG